jgi:hypothetical protein
MQERGFPLYQWTALEEKSRLRLVAFSYRGTQDEGRLFMALTVAWLRKLGIRKPILLQTDHGSEFGGRKAKEKTPGYGPWELRDLGMMGARHVRYPVGRKEYNGRVERSHRTDDEDFYLRTSQHFQNLEEFMNGALEWLVEYNVNRFHYGKGMDGLTPLEAFCKHYGCPDVVEFPLVLLDDLSTMFVLTFLPWPPTQGWFNMCRQSTPVLDILLCAPYIYDSPGTGGEHVGPQR